MSIQNIQIDGTGNFNNSTENAGVINYGNFSDTAINSGTVSLSATFSLSATNYGTVSGLAIFTGDSVNTGTVAIAEFKENSVNAGFVSTSAMFSDSAQNTGTIVGDAIFADTTVNTGTVQGDAQVAATADNSGGTVNGSVTEYTPSGNPAQGTVLSAGVVNYATVDGDQIPNGTYDVIADGNGGSTNSYQYPSFSTIEISATEINAEWYTPDGTVINSKWYHFDGIGNVWLFNGVNASSNKRISNGVQTLVNVFSGSNYQNTHLWTDGLFRTGYNFTPAGVQKIDVFGSNAILDKWYIFDGNGNGMYPPAGTYSAYSIPSNTTRWFTFDGEGNGTIIGNTTIQVSGTWYTFNEYTPTYTDGIMGLSGIWYEFDNGSLVGYPIGIRQANNGTWYNFDGDGTLNDNGPWPAGIHQLSAYDNKWYTFDGSGNGSYPTGLIQLDSDWYVFDGLGGGEYADGAEPRGYFLYNFSNGIETGQITDGGNYQSTNGIWYTTGNYGGVNGWYSYSSGTAQANNGSWYDFDGNGGAEFATGLKQANNGNWYTFDGVGGAVYVTAGTIQLATDNDKWYTFDGVGGGTYATGTFQLASDANKWYTFDGNGGSVYATGTLLATDGKWYTFDGNGGGVLFNGAIYGNDGKWKAVYQGEVSYDITINGVNNGIWYLGNHPNTQSLVDKWYDFNALNYANDTKQSTLDGKWYTFDGVGGGTYATGTFQLASDANKWYTFDGNGGGIYATGTLLATDGKWYTFDGNGGSVYATGTLQIAFDDNKWYTFDGNGGGTYASGTFQLASDANKWYTFDGIGGGVYANGYVSVNNVWYLFDGTGSGTVAPKGVVLVNGSYYRFDGTGAGVMVYQITDTVSNTVYYASAAILTYGTMVYDNTGTEHNGLSDLTLGEMIYNIGDSAPNLGKVLGIVDTNPYN